MDKENECDHERWVLTHKSLLTERAWDSISNPKLFFFSKWHTMVPKHFSKNLKTLLVLQWGRWSWFNIMYYDMFMLHSRGLWYVPEQNSSKRRRGGEWERWGWRGRKQQRTSWECRNWEVLCQWQHRGSSFGIVSALLIFLRANSFR